MSKELFIKAQEELVEEYLAKYSKATEEEALKAIEDKIFDRYSDKIGDMIDTVRQMKKDGYL